LISLSATLILFGWTYAELPENFKCLMDCEAAVMLQGIQDQMVALSRDPSIKMPA